MTHVVALVSEGAVPPLEENHLPMAQFAYGLVALGFFALLLGFLWTFRNFAANLGSTPSFRTEDGKDASGNGAHGSGH